MKIFGYKWPEHQFEQYEKTAIDGVTVWERKGLDLIYECYCCREPFLHWVVNDCSWKRLPKALQTKVICLNCFRTTRALRRLKCIVEDKDGE